MSAAPPPVAVSGSLFSRVKQILLQPSSEWRVIDAEPTTVGSIYMGYVLPLAAIPAICLLIGWGFIGGAFFGAVGLAVAIRIAIASFVGSLIHVYVMSLIVDYLAPNFGGSRNMVQATKLAAYSMTASWVVGVFYLVPVLTPLAILGIYSLYLFYVGLPILMKAPADRAMSYTIVAILAAIVVRFVLHAITNSLVGSYGYY